MAFGRYILAVPRIDGFTNEFVAWATAAGAFDGFYSSPTVGPSVETAADLLSRYQQRGLRERPGLLPPNYWPPEESVTVPSGSNSGGSQQLQTTGLPATQEAPSNLPWLALIALALFLLAMKG